MRHALRKARQCRRKGCRARLPAGGKALFCSTACRMAAHRYRRKLAVAGQALSTRSLQQWQTPTYVLDAARAAMGGIDLDPASCASANKRVGAASYFDPDTDGLAAAWPSGSRVWLNPPYATQLIRAFVARALQHDGPAILLTNNATSTLWAQRLLEGGAHVCCLRERVRFIDPATGQPAGSGPLQGQIVWGLRVEPAAFASAFGPLGPLR